MFSLPIIPVLSRRKQATNSVPSLISEADENMGFTFDIAINEFKIIEGLGPAHWALHKA